MPDVITQASPTEISIDKTVSTVISLDALVSANDSFNSELTSLNVQISQLQTQITLYEAQKTLLLSQQKDNEALITQAKSLGVVTAAELTAEANPVQGGTVLTPG